MKRGAALPMVLFSIAIGSAMVVGGAYVTRQMATGSTTAQKGALLDPLAEGALVGALAAWDSTKRASQPLGATEQLSSVSLPGASTSTWITRLTDQTWWLVSEATVLHKPLMRRRLGLLVLVVDGAPYAVPTRAWAELP